MTTPQIHDCEACRGNVATGKSCYACGLSGPAGQGVLATEDAAPLNEIAEVCQDCDGGPSVDEPAVPFDPGSAITDMLFTQVEHMISECRAGRVPAARVLAQLGRLAESGLALHNTVTVPDAVPRDRGFGSSMNQLGTFEGPQSGYNMPAPSGFDGETYGAQVIDQLSSTFGRMMSNISALQSPDKVVRAIRDARKDGLDDVADAMKAKLYEAYGIELPDSEDEIPDPEPGDGIVLDMSAQGADASHASPA